MQNYYLPKYGKTKRKQSDKLSKCNMNIVSKLSKYEMSI
jgi:hypothetical protein